MRREIYIDRQGFDDRPRRGRNDCHGHGEKFYHHDKGRGKHTYGGRRDSMGPHFEEGCNTEERMHPHHKIYRHKYHRTNVISKTKMFSSKKELVDYVNKVGENGQQVDIFKIEDELYKVVVYGKQEVQEEKEETEE